jgi:hypothetical protein
MGAAKVRMLAYNGSIPGPTMKVQNGSGSPSMSRTKAM